MRWLIGMVITHLVVACYQPETIDCTLRCGAPTDCADGQSCSNGWCAADGVRCDEQDQPATSDARVNPTTPDAANANALCQQGCSKGTCVDGVCVIDCSNAESCDGDVDCPANVPCRVTCGNNACTKKINCTQSTSCDIRCTGQAACAGEIQCSAGACNVTCSGPGACKQRTRCANSCSCDVTCTGAGSCAEESACPGSACRVGSGCSSTPSGCDTCS